MEPLTLTKEPVVEKDAMEESTDFYRGMAEELSSLARLSAEIQWAPDVPLRAKRTVAVPRVAATGRLPRPEPREPRAAPRRVPEWPREPREPPPVARDVTEVSTKRPPHLAIHTRPVRTAARRGLQTPQGRRLRLGAKAAKPSKESAGTEVELSHEEKTIEATAMPVAVPSVPPVPPPAAGPELVSRAVSVQEDLLSRPETYGESALSDVYEAAFREDPPIPRPQVQLLEVLDLQLFLPARTVTATPAEVFQVFQARESHLPQREISEEPSPRRHPEPSKSASPRTKEHFNFQAFQATQRPLRGLILDVIDEMSKPTAYQEPAEVVGGSELAPLFTSEARRSMPLDEDTYGRRLGRIPPPYEVGPPPPYDGLGPAVTEAEEQLRKTLQKKQEQLESKEKALAASQAEAQAQVKHLVNEKRKRRKRKRKRGTLQMQLLQVEV